MNKNKLLIVIGAGASIDLDMPSVYGIDKLLDKFAKQYCPLANTPDKSFYAYFREKIIEYYNQEPKKHIRKTTNFEEIFHLFLQISSLKKDSFHNVYSNPLNAFINVKEFEKVLMFGKEKCLSDMDFYHIVSYLIDELLNDFRKRCINVQSKKSVEFKEFKKFMNNLNDDFEIGCICLNYDNLIKQALPDLKTGFDENQGIFYNNSIYNTKDWNFIYHIHGSVHFDMRHDKYDLHSIRWNNDLNSQFQQNSSGRSSQDTIEGLSHPTSTIITGYDKTNQILRDPFRSYYSILNKLIYEADSFLFVGYGFNDLHINKSFQGFRNHPKRRPVLVIDWANDDADSLNYRNDSWANNLCKTIPVNAYDMSFSGTSADIRELKVNKDFEISNDSNHPLSICYWGFIEACKNYDKIKKFL